MQTAAAGCRWNGCSERGHAQVARTNRTPETEAGGGGRQAGVSGDQSSDHSETLDTTTKSIRAQDGTTQRIGPAWRPVIGLFFSCQASSFLVTPLLLKLTVFFSLLFFFLSDRSSFLFFSVAPFFCSCLNYYLVPGECVKLSSPGQCRLCERRKRTRKSRAGHNGSSASGK